MQGAGSMDHASGFRVRAGNSDLGRHDAGNRERIFIELMTSDRKLKASTEGST